MNQTHPQNQQQDQQYAQNQQQDQQYVQNQQQAQQYAQNQQQAYPQPPYMPQAAPEKKLRRQTCGFILTCLLLVFSCIAGLDSLYEACCMLFRLSDGTFGGLEFTSNIFASAGSFIDAAFFALTLFKPEFLAGKPDKKIILYLAVANGCVAICESIENPENALQIFAGHSLAAAIIFLMYFGDDESKSCCNCFKPWVYKTVPSFYPYPDQGPQFMPQQQHQSQVHPQSIPQYDQKLPNV
jgi:hypothetical protein